ncbi:hypothetical protein [Paracnuella aquatica]|uniref:hypothetical protein n=1 Tax=Paracnuella aquatica TaxID=2268757 RepID=UPI000DEF9EFB|nr:hypothetical protein [Paracnuella aquatica]RPD51459.1 hypothetical protein DRJ53_01905 [Paracnuella aquatica]
MKNAFLLRLYRQNRNLFWGFTLFFFFTIVGNLLGDEVTPFFVYGMYSQKQTRPTQYEVVQIIVNDTIDLARTNYFTYNKAMVQKPIFYYAAMQQNKGIDPTILFLQDKLKNHYSKVRLLEENLFNTAKELNSFKQWFPKYLQQHLCTPISSINVKMLSVRFTGEYNLVLDSAKTLLQWKYQRK